MTTAINVLTVFIRKEDYSTLNDLKKMILLRLKIRLGKFYIERMPIRFLQLVFISVVILLLPLNSKAQNTLEVGVFGGASYYLGDINPAVHFSQLQFTYGGVARYNLSNRWTIKGSYYHGKLKGSDEITNAVENRDLSFLTKINDISVVAEFNWWDYFTGSKKSFFTPYIFAGVSYFMYKPQTLNGVDLRSEGTEGQNVGFDGRQPYSLWSFAVPFGLGFKYSINSRLGAAFEWGLRKTFTDYIDDVSTTYANNPDDIADPTQSHSAYMQRGDRTKNDWYSTIGITLTYKFNLYNRNKCNTRSY